MRLSRLDLAVIVTTVVIIAALVLSAIIFRPPSQPMRIAYIAPATGGLPNLWVANPDEPDSARQVTFTEGGVFDYAPSPDGRKIIFSERKLPENRINMMLLNLDTGDVSTLADCAAVDSDCTSVSWRPDGDAIAYVRRIYDPLFGGGGNPKIWMIDGLNTPAPRDYPMFNDDQTIGSGPTWSADGRRLAFYEESARGVLVFDFNPPDESERLKFIPADNGMTGSLSPSGEQLITSSLVIAGELSVRMQLIIADLRLNDSRDLFPDGESNDGVAAAWHPDGQRVAILRQYTSGARATQGQQVFIYDLVTQTLTPLTEDEAFNNGALSFSPDGNRLMIQRFQYGNYQPGIWVYDMPTGAMVERAPNAYLGAWVPATE